MNLTNIKLQELDNKSQIITFDQKGNMIDSCDSIVAISAKKVNVFESFDFLFGIEDQILSLKKEDHYKINCIYTSFFGAEAHYDIILKKLEDDLFSICAYNYNEQYLKIQGVQQERNVSIIRKEELQRKNKEIEAEKETIERLYSELSDQKPREFIFIRADHLWVNLDLNDIFVVEGYGDYVKIHTSEKVYVTHYRLKHVEDKIMDAGFIRVHRSYIVKINKITNFDSSNLEINGKIIPVSASYKNALLERINPI